MVEMSGVEPESTQIPHGFTVCLTLFIPIVAHRSPVSALVHRKWYIPTTVVLRSLYEDLTAKLDVLRFRQDNAPKTTESAARP